MEYKHNPAESPDDLGPSASYAFAFRQVVHRGGSDEEAHQAGIRAHLESVWGADCKKHSKGNYIPQGIGSDSNPSMSHFQALQANERRGLEKPGTYDRLVREFFKRDRATALSFGLREPEKA